MEICKIIMDHGNPQAGLVKTDLVFVDISLDPTTDISDEINKRWKRKEGSNST